MIFLEIIDNEKIEKSDETDDDMYILYVKRYAIRICSGLERWCVIWWYVHIAHQDYCI
jgi:hypothetical protein